MFIFGYLFRVSRHGSCKGASDAWRTSYEVRMLSSQNTRFDLRLVAGVKFNFGGAVDGGTEVQGTSARSLGTSQLCV